MQNKRHTRVRLLVALYSLNVNETNSRLATLHGPQKVLLVALHAQVHPRATREHLLLCHSTAAPLRLTLPWPITSLTSCERAAWTHRVRPWGSTYRGIVGTTGGPSGHHFGNTLLWRERRGLVPATILVWGELRGLVPATILWDTRFS